MALITYIPQLTGGNRRLAVHLFKERNGRPNEPPHYRGLPRVAAVGVVVVGGAGGVADVALHPGEEDEEDQDDEGRRPRHEHQVGAEKKEEGVAALPTEIHVGSKQGSNKPCITSPFS